MNEDIGNLIAKYLDGSISDDETRRLDEALRTDADARLELHRAACLETALRDACATAGAQRAVPRRAAFRPWAIAAAAAVVALVTGMALIAAHRQAYPALRVEGDVRILRAGAPVTATVVARGDRLVAGPAGGRLTIGGYCALSLLPDAEVVVKGEPHREAVELQSGCLLSKVVHGKGEFRVETALGSVKVVGTEFLVSVDGARPRTEGATPMLKQASVTVMVMAGVVTAYFGGDVVALAAGESRTFVAAAEESLRPSLITLNVTAAKLADVLAAIADQSGNRPLTVSADVTPQPVTLRVDKLSYWETVDKLCAQQDLVCRGNQKDKLMELAPADAKPSLTCYAGAMVFRLAPLTDKPDPKDPTTRQVGCRVDFFWEGRLRFGAFNTPVVMDKVVDSAGKECAIGGVTLTCGGLRSAGGAKTRVQKLEANPDMNWASVQFALTVPAGKGGEAPAVVGPVDHVRRPDALPALPQRTLPEIAGSVTLFQQDAPVVIRIENAFAEGQPSAEHGGYKLTVVKALRDKGNVSLQVEVTKADKRVEPAWPGRRGWTLTDSAGKTFEGMLMNGRYLFFLHADKIADGPCALVRTFAPDGEPVACRFLFKDVPLP